MIWVNPNKSIKMSCDKNYFLYAFVWECVLKLLVKTNVVVNIYIKQMSSDSVIIFEFLFLCKDYRIKLKKCNLIGVMFLISVSG